MPRVARILSAYAAVLLVLLCIALLGGYLLGFFDGPVDRFRLRASHDAYEAGAARAIATERGSVPDGTFAPHSLDETRRDLVSGTTVFYLRTNGTDYVYFPLEDVVTMSGGLMYSSTGVRPPETSCISVLADLEPHWYRVGFNNATLEAGYLIP